LPFAAAGVGIGIAAYVIPDSTYRISWRTPKFFDVAGLRVTLACVLAFVSGSFCGAGLLPRKPSTHTANAPGEFPEKWMWSMFRLSFYLCILGYVLWTGLAIQRGITIKAVLDILTGEKGAMYEARFTYLPTVGGVTTLSQFGTAMMILAANLAYRRGWRAVWGKVAIVLGLAAVRALVNSERFAIIELVVPFLVASLALRYIGSQSIGRRVRALVQFAPVIGVVALFSLFTGFEYFRSWSNYYAGRDLTLWEFSAMRLLGYYVTSFNNGSYLLQRLETLGAPYFSLHFLWMFPFSDRLVKHLFQNPLLESSEKWFYFPFLESEANVEFNNADGMLFPLMDFGIAGGLIYWLIIGLICGLVYELFCRKDALGIFLYPMIFLGLMEVPLTLYWGEGRAVPSLVLLTSIPLLFAFARAQYGWLLTPRPKRNTAAQPS
jgi:oligosaccharide repeat unit polymerase